MIPQSVLPNVLATVKCKFSGDIKWHTRTDFDIIITENNFFLQKGQDAYYDFMESAMDIPKLIKVFREIELLNDAKSIRQVFSALELPADLTIKLYTLMAYLEESAPDKVLYNKYKPKRRDLSKSGLFPAYWMKELIRLRLCRNTDLLNYEQVKHSINYIADPMNQISIVSSQDRETLSTKLLEKPELDNDSFCDDIKNVFAEHERKVANPINFSILCARMLYDKDIKRIWQ